MSDPIPSVVNLRLPTPDTPGFLRRRIRFSRMQLDLKEFQDKAKAAPDDIAVARQAIDLMEAMARAAAEFVEAPPGVDPAEAVLELSENDFKAVFEALGGAAQTPPLAGPSAPPSAAG